MSSETDSNESYAPTCCIRFTRNCCSSLVGMRDRLGLQMTPHYSTRILFWFSANITLWLKVPIRCGIPRTLRPTYLVPTRHTKHTLQPTSCPPPDTMEHAARKPSRFHVLSSRQRPCSFDCRTRRDQQGGEHAVFCRGPSAQGTA